MTYLEARRIEKLFRRYRQLVIAYWEAVEPTNATWTAGPGAKLFRDTAASGLLREEITRLMPEVIHRALGIGMAVTGHSYPAPAGGGPVIPFNFLACATDLWIGHKYVEGQDVLDAIDRCIGAAEFGKGRALARLLKPWCWLIDAPALIVYWPFAVMRKAGVPDKIVDSTGAQVIKAILTTVVTVVTFVWIAYTTGIAAAVESVFSRLASVR